MAAIESLRLMDICAEYGKASYQKAVSLRLSETSLPPPICHSDVPVGFQAELRVIAQRMVEAMTNQVVIPWNSRSYGASIGKQSGDDPEFEARLQEQFVPLAGFQPTNRPFSLIDDSEELVFLYLPDMLLPERQAAIANAVLLSSDAIAAHPPKPDNIGKTSRWRNSRYLFARNDELEFGRGMITLSPGWLAQGQESYNDPLYVSRDLAARPGGADNAAQVSAQAWLGANFETGLLLSTALAIAHPAQYHETRQALGYLATLQDFGRHMEAWTFAFNAVTLICNRLTPLHRDRSSGGAEFLDLLLSIGGGPRTILSLPGLGIQVQYDSGAVAMFSGHQHLHEVWGFDQERACVACYAKAPVIRWLGRRHPSPPSGSATLPEGWWQALANIPGVRRYGVKTDGSASQRV
ncbi:unnamed protein product [Peniophora sp. CBMAI 1063]|nr:unnamed protein product [Peniophora sp. CBMAI 1063]